MSALRSPLAKALLIAGIAVVLMLAFFGFRAERVQVELAVAEQRPIVESIREEGRTRVIRRYTVTAPLAGFVSRVELRPGDRVAAGDVVATISASAGALLDPATADRLSSELAAARAQVAASRARLRSAASAAELARSEWARIEPLVAKGTLSGMDGDRARTAARRAQEDLEAARYALTLAEAQVDANRALLERQGERGESLVDVVAPVAGVVLQRWRESQGPVAVGERLLDLGDPGALEVEVDLLSADAVRVAEGMAVRLHRWGGDQPLLARVRRIEPVASMKVSALGVEEQRTWVWSELVSPPEQWARLGDGYRVEAEFVLSEASGLAIPDAALFRRGDGWTVYIADGDVARERGVDIGRSSGIDTEVTAGLSAGDRVIVHPDDRVIDGTRIRVVAPH
jgi:HlyD family secretion protein